MAALSLRSDIDLFGNGEGLIVAVILILGVHFRPRAADTRELASAPTKLRTANPTAVCLFSGGLDSFIGAIDLLAIGQAPMLVSHY